jgi:hypothetical protein
MRCKTLKKLLTDFVDGRLAERRADQVREHLARCPACREDEAAARVVPEALKAWEDSPPPEDGLARLEARIALAPSIPWRSEPRGRIRVLAFSYAAGFATAAAVMFIAMAIWGGPGSGSVDPIVPASSDPLFVDSGSDLLPGEVPLHLVGPEGDLRKIAWDDPDVIRALRRHMTEEQLRDIRARTDSVPAGYWGD